MSESTMIWESDLAKRLGVERSHLTGRRKDLERGRDWDVVNKRTMYTQEGVEAMLEALGVKDDVQVATELPKETLTCLGRHGVNPRYIRAKRDCGEEVSVRVQSTEKFTAGMRVPCRLEGNTWACTRPAPRWRGRW